MTVILRGSEQDTLKINQISIKDSASRTIDPVPRKQVRFQKTAEVFTYADTTMFCSRNSISGVSYSDPGNFLMNIRPAGGDRTLFTFAERSKLLKAETREILESKLKSGEALPERQIHNDWIIIIIISAAFLLGLVRNATKGFHPLARFFLFRGINDPDSRDTGGLFQWQTTILNLISFLVISLFVYLAAVHYDLIPYGVSGIVFWLGSLGVIILSLTIRHAVCVATGSLSGQKEVFNEYLLGIYQSYQFGALLIFILVILLSYNSILPEGALFITGFLIAGLMYLFRVIRLLIIFMNRNISVFYLILYLCALEILPVAIAARYFLGTDQIG